MKSVIILFSFCCSVSVLAGLGHHLDLDLSSTEYRRLLGDQKAPLSALEATGPIDEALFFGERLLAWLDLINEGRPEGQKIQLSSKETRKGIPITSPMRYNPSRVKADLDSLRGEIPKSMGDMLFSQKQLSADPGVDDKVFIEFGRRMDRIYQTSARWKLLEPYKGFYVTRRARDVRGIYFLRQNNWDLDRLRQEWELLKADEKEPLANALIGICMNSGLDFRPCQRAVDGLKTGADAAGFHRRYFPGAQKVWDSFFDIQNPRRDITWKGPNEAQIPFLDPGVKAIQDFVKLNIEDEFQWLGWGLKINFTQRKPAPYIVFIPGQTANVERLGGNRIEMDANKSLDEYEEQWIIRHEFGHVLGIPDCYHEFYDKDAEEFVNYQIDTTDLMCSRAGNMNQRIYDQLRASYATH